MAYRNSARRMVVCILAALLSGCAAVPAPSTKPEAPVPNRFARAEEAFAETPGARRDPVDWQHYFLDPNLLRVLKLALAHNRDMKSAVLRVAEARAQHGIRRSDRFPTLDGQADLARSRTPESLSPTGKAETGSVYEVAVGVAGWELDFWGRVRSLEKAALEQYLASEAAQRAFTVSLLAEVANTWLTQREYDRRIELARQSIATREESLRIFTRRFELGAATRLELTQVRALLVQAQTLAVHLEQARENNGHYLAFLAGATVDTTPRSKVLDGKAVLLPIAPGLPSDLLVHRPDIIAAEHRLAAAHADIHAARVAFFPRISLTGSLGLAGPELDNLFESASRTWSFMPAVTVPIFNAGRLRASLDLAEIRRDMAVAEYERTIQQAFREVSDALSARHWLMQQLDIQQQGMATQRERAHLAQLRYDNGTTSYLDVLDAQRELLQAEQETVQTQRLLLSSQVNLYAALGGGALGQGASMSVFPQADSSRHRLREHR
ncbi:MAG: efflux transporter outer membrane subunit [Desulfobulbus sp.]|jgi:multidrug efflux system outer membrane protein